MSGRSLPIELDYGYFETVQGYGQSSYGQSWVYRPASVDEIREVLRLARQTSRRVCLRGSGRSYGDANYLEESITIDITRMDRILSWDRETGILEAEAGVTIEDMWRHVLEDGYWPPVVTGTMYPCLGGALGMNVHGKNNYCRGTLGEQVLEIDVLNAAGDLRTLTPNDADYFAIISSAGLLGIITRVKIQMHAVDSGDLKVWAESADDWREQFELFEKYEHNSDYMVSWVDCFGRGAQAGRGLFHAAWYKEGIDPKSLKEEKQDLPSLILGFFPKSALWKILKLFCNRTGMRFINWAKYVSGSTLGNNKMHDQSLVAFSFLLDYVPDWRRAYEPGGFIQYQTFVPKEHAKRVFARQVELQQEAKLESFLGVLKRHRPDNFLFSHAVDGYSFALDFKVTAKNRERLWKLAHQMNDLVLEAGGRFYLAKDSTLRPEDVSQWLGPEKMARYKALKAEWDPEGIFATAQSDRLGLTQRPR